MSAAGIAAQPPSRPAGRLQSIVVIAITVIGIAILAFFIAPSKDDGLTTIDLTGNVAAAAPQVGAAPPSFTGVLYDGSPVSLADYAGKPLWLTFGASWCPDCRVEAQDLEATYEKYRPQGLAVLGVFIREPAADVKGYAERAGLTFPIAVDERTVVASAYRTMGIPTHYFIGADGRVREIRIGAMSPADMERAVAAIMN